MQLHWMDGWIDGCWCGIWEEYLRQSIVFELRITTMDGKHRVRGSCQSVNVALVDVPVPVYSNYHSIDMAWDDEPPTQLPTYKD